MITATTLKVILQKIPSNPGTHYLTDEAKYKQKSLQCCARYCYGNSIWIIQNKKNKTKKINMLVWSSTDGNYHYSGCSVIQLTDTFKLTSGSIIKLYTRVTERTKIMLTPARVLLQKGLCWTCQRQSVFLINRLTDTSARQWLTPKWKSPCGALIVNTFSVYIDHFSQERIVCFLYLASNWQVDLLPTGLKLGSQCRWLKWSGSG